MNKIGQVVEILSDALGITDCSQLDVVLLARQAKLRMAKVETANAELRRINKELSDELKEVKALAVRDEW